MWTRLPPGAAAARGSHMSDSPHTVLITGTSSGFGALMARTLAAAGHRVFAAMRGVECSNAGPAGELRAWAARERLALAVIEMDVTVTGSIAAAVAAILADAGRIDVLVNNAGRGAFGPFEAFSLAQIESLFSLNVLGPIRVAKAVLPSMRHRRSGLIVNVSSTIGRILPGVGGLYPTTKWALEGFAESLSYEVRPFGIDAVILEPGAFPSPALSKAMTPAALAAAYAEAYADGTVHDPPPAPLSPPSPAASAYRLPELQLVANAVKDLIDMPAGTRPLRSVVGTIFVEGVAEYNDAYARASRQLAAALRRPDQAVTWGPQTPR
jgi:NAD(P)-dependent dehydrogenase (short-subunit alcohol dehydrogenase family)